MSKKGIIVGTGYAATMLHLPAYRRVGAEIRALVDITAENARKVASANGVPAGYDSIEEAVAQEKADFVSICTPPATHYPLAKRAVEAGCHVLVEKPVASNYQEALQLKELAEAKNRIVAVVHNRRFYPGMLEAAKLMKKEAIGHVLHVDRQMHFVPQTVRMMEPEHWAHKLPGGRFFEANPHSMYLISQFVTGMKVEKVQLFRRSDHWPHSPITGFSALLSGRNREGEAASVNLTMSLDHEPRVGRGAGTQITVVHGTKGTMVVDGPTCHLVDAIGSRSLSGSSGGALVRELLARVRQKFSGGSSGKKSDGGKGKEHAFMIGHFIRQMEGTETGPLVAWDEVLETQRVNDELGQAVERELAEGRVWQEPGPSS